MNLKTLQNFIPVLALPATIYFSDIGSYLSPYTAHLLSVLLFFSFVGLGLSDLKKALRHPSDAFFTAITVLIATPLVAYPIMQEFFPEFFIGAMIFMLMPSAVSSPAITAIYKGDVAIATVNSVIANLLSPFTITLFFSLFLQTQVEIDLTRVLIQTATIIFIPFAISLWADRKFHNQIKKVKSSFRLITLTLMFLIFWAALSPYVAQLTENLLNQKLWLAVFFALVILYFFAKIFVLHTPKKEAIAVQANILFLNVALGVVIAQNYFGPEEMLFLIYAQIVWMFMVGLFKYLK